MPVQETARRFHMMDSNADQEKLKQFISDVFNRVSGGYDSAALRYFPFVADRLVEISKIIPGEKILDAATGTGAVATSAAQRTGSTGRVYAIDLAEGMIERAMQHATRMGLTNIDFFVMDAQTPEFRSSYFHTLLCSFGLFLLPDMEAALRSWKRVLRPGGKLLFTGFSKQAFRPLCDLFRQRLIQYGVDSTGQTQVFAWHRISDEAVCRKLMENAGFTGIEVRREQHGYHLGHAEEWWEILWNSGFRGLLDGVPVDQLEAFRSEHLAEIEALAGEHGIWMDVDVLFYKGVRPDSS